MRQILSVIVKQYLLLAILMVCCTTLGRTQADGRTVSEIWQEYRVATEDSTQIAALTALAGAYVNVNLDSALLLGETALELAQQVGLRALEAGAYVSLGEVYDIAGQLDPALDHLDQGLALFIDLGNEKGIARAYNSRGLARLYGNGDLEQAQRDFKDARSAAKAIKDYASIAKVNHNLGQIYHSKGDSLPLALDYYLQARNLKDSLIAANAPGITVRDQISTYNNLGVFYANVYQYDNAREATNKALELIPSEEHRRRAIILYSLGEIEVEDSSYNEALKYFQESLAAAQEGGFSLYIPNIYDGMGKSYLMLNSEEAAGNYFSLALDLLNGDLPKPDVKVGVLAHQGELFLRQGKYFAALDNANEALDIVGKNDNIPQKNIRDAHEVKALAAQALGDFATATTHFQSYITINKAIENEEHKKQYVGLQAVHDVDLRDQKHLRDLAEQKLRLSEEWVFWLKIALTIAGLLAIAFAVAKFRETRAKQEVIKVNAELEDLNLEQASTNQKLNLANNKLRQFAFATGHDLKESLRNITSFTQLASIELAQDPPKAQTHLHEATAGGKRMRKMLDDLLHYSNLGGSDTTVSRFSLDEAVSSVKQQLKEDIENEQGEVHLATPVTLKANRTEIEQIFFNLVHNALRYRKPDVDPQVTIKAEKREEKLVFVVCDNGQGVPAEHQKAIFQPFYRLHDRAQSGSGLGLSITRTIVDNYGGEIWYEKNEQGYSCFCFTLPNAEPKAQLNPNIYVP